VLAQRRRVFPPASAFGDLRQHLDLLLTDPGTRLPSLTHLLTAAADDACAAAGGLGAAPLGADDKKALASLVSNAADPSNAVFALFAKRAFALLTAMLNAPGPAPPPAVTAAVASATAGAGAGVARGAAMAALGNLMGGGGGSGGAYPSAVDTALDASLAASGLGPFRAILLEAGHALRRVASHQLRAFGPSHFAPIAAAAAKGLPPAPAAPMA